MSILSSICILLSAFAILYGVKNSDLDIIKLNTKIIILFAFIPIIAWVAKYL